VTVSFAIIIIIIIIVVVVVVVVVVVIIIIISIRTKCANADTCTMKKQQLVLWTVGCCSRCGSCSETVWMCVCTCI